MDARYLTQADRDAFKLAIIARRDAVGRVIKRMEAKHWYTNDAVLNDLRAAGMRCTPPFLAAIDGQPVTQHQQGPRYPL